MGRIPTIAAALGLMLVAGTSTPAAAQLCTWGGTSTVDAPVATPLRSLGGPSQAPTRLAVDAQGNLYTTDPAAGSVGIRDPFGRPVGLLDGLRSPLAIALDELGSLYVSDTATGSVAVFDPDGRLRERLGQGEGEFLLPNDIAVDPLDGTVYVSDGEAHRIKIYSPAGAFLGSFGGRGGDLGQLDFPAAVWISPAGEIFVADQNNDRIQVFDRDGRVLRCFGSRSTAFRRRFGRIQGLLGDTQGRIYVADALLGQVLVFDPQGAPLGAIGDFGEGLGELRTPMGMALDPFHRLFVASVNNSRVEVFGIDAFSDPRDGIEATVAVRPNPLRKPSKRPFLAIFLELAGAPVEEVDPSTVTANGVPAQPHPTEIGDFDDDGLPDLRVKVEAEALLATLTEGEAIVVVTGELLDGSRFEGATEVEVRGKGRKSEDDDDDDD